MALQVINSSPTMGLGGAAYNSTSLLQPASYPSTTTGTAPTTYVAPYYADTTPTYDPTGTTSYDTTGGTTSTATATPTIDYNLLNQYDQAIGNVNTGISQLDPQQQVGLSNINTGYNSSLNQLLQAEAQNQQAYNTNKTQTAQDYVGTKNQIGSYAGNSLNGLQRLLGSRGAGGSSAYLFNAPQAVAQMASQQRSAAGQTFGRNQQALDTNWNNYETGVGSSKTNLANQKTNSVNSLQSQIDTSRANLLQSLATLQAQRAAVAGGSPTGAAQPYLDQANSYLSQATQLGQQVPVYQTNPTTYNAPTLDHYTANQFATPQVSGSNVPSDGVAPSLAYLLGANKDKTQSTVTA